MRREPDHFGDQDLDLIYVAKKLKESLALEKVLEDAGLDYLVEPDTYTGGLLFRSERIGAFFYVTPADAPIAREVLGRQGYTPYELGPDSGKSV